MPKINHPLPFVQQALTFEQISYIAIRAFKELKKGRGLREGQAVVNAAHDLFPKQTDELRNTEVDCFYNSERIPKFFAALADDNAKAWVDKLTKEVYEKV